MRALAAADALDFDVVEWENKESYYDAGERQSAMDRFAAFVHGAQRYPVLPLAPRNTPQFVPRRRKAILVEDLPNLAHDATRAQFHQVLEQVVQRTSSANVPLILIVSDSVPRAEDEAAAMAGASSTWRARRDAQMDVRAAVPESVRTHASFAEIRFNPLTSRMIQSALSRRAAELGVSRSALAEISSASAGDVRGASNTLALLAAGRARAGAKRKSDGEVPAGLLARTSAMVLFHAIGRVLYNKRAGDPGLEAEIPPKSSNATMTSWMQPLRDEIAPPRPWLDDRRESLVEVDELWADLPVDPSTFQLYLYHNYTPFTNELEEAMHFSDALSCAESMPVPPDEPRAAPAAALYGFEIATRGALLALPSPVPRRGQALTKPAFYDMAQRARACEEQLADVRASLARPDLIGDKSDAANVPLVTLATEVLPLLARMDPSGSGTPLLRFAEDHQLSEAAHDDLDLPPADPLVMRPRPAQTLQGPWRLRTGRATEAAAHSSEDELEELS